MPYLQTVTVHGRKVICHSSLKKWVDSWQKGALLPTHKVLRQQAAANPTETRPAHETNHGLLSQWPTHGKNPNQTHGQQKAKTFSNAEQSDDTTTQ